MPWHGVRDSAQRAENKQGPHGRRVVCVWCEDPSSPETWHGAYGTCPVATGVAAIQFSDGETVAL